jgi:ABC-2 type transport system ATP-binding protein
VADRVTAIASVLQELGHEGVAIDDIGLRRPTLDDVFLALTGHAAEEDSTDDQAGRPDGSGDGADDGRQAGAPGDGRAGSDGDRIMQETESS